MFETEVLNGLLRVGGGGRVVGCAPINKTNLAGKQCLLDIKPNFLDQFQGKVIQLAEIIRELIMISERLMIQQLNDMQLHVLLRSTSTVWNTYFVFWFSVPCLWQNKKMCVSISLPSSKFAIFLILFVHMMLKTLLIPAVCRRHVIYNHSNKPGHCRVSTAQW